MKHKSNLFINIGDEYNKKHKFPKNKSLKFNSLNNNKSLTTNASGTAFSSLQNSIDNNFFKNNYNKKNINIKKTNSKFSSINLFTNYFSTRESNKNNNVFLPDINFPNKTVNIFEKADEIIKLRHGKYIGATLKQTKSTLLNKTNKICLNNFLITQLKEKRNQISNLDKEISSKLSKAENELNSDYKNFIHLEENFNNSIKKQEEEFNNLRQLTTKGENAYLEELLISQNLEQKIENITKRIILLQNYAKFIHKVLDIPFFFEDLNKINLKEKKYLQIYNKIMILFDKNKNIFEENYYILNESKEFIKHFQTFEKKIVHNFQIKDKIEDEIKYIKSLNNKLLEQLIIRKKYFEQEYNYLNGILSKTKEEINYFNNIKQNNSENLEICRSCIFDLGKDLSLEQKKSIEEISISDFVALTKKIMTFIQGKEYTVNNHINNISNLINSEDKEIIEKIIYERKRTIKKEKYQEILYKQKIEAEKRKFRTYKTDKKRLVIKGRKVFKEIPFFKKKMKIVNKNINNNYETLENYNFYFDN